MSKDSLCSKPTSFFVLGPSVSYPWAQKFCKDIGAKMAVIKSNEIMLKMYTDTGDMVTTKDMMVWNGYNDKEKVFNS